MKYINLLLIGILSMTFASHVYSEKNLDSRLQFQKPQKTFKGTLDRVKNLPTKKQQKTKQLVFPKMNQSFASNNPWSKSPKKQQGNNQQLSHARVNGNPWAPNADNSNLTLSSDVLNFEKNPYTNNEMPFGMNQGFNGMSESFNNYYQNMTSPYFNDFNANPNNFAYGVNPLFALPNYGVALPYNQNLWSNQQFWPQNNFLNSAMPFTTW